jgi:hypothetical protein
MTTMQACIWCSPDIGTIEGGDKTDLCGCCSEHFSLPPDGPIQKHLDELSFPVLGVELYAGKRMITRSVNKSACAWLNKRPGEIVQHLTGNVIGCVHARLPEGCGGSLPCEACEVLRSVAGTVKTGEPLIAVPAMLQQEYAGQVLVLTLKLTTMKAGGLVLLRLDTGPSSVRGTVPWP